MPIDLSAVSDDGMALILLRVPIKDLIGKCTQVSPQWNRILSESFFWRNKMEYDGYALDWPKLANLSTKSIQFIALKHCFGRNFIKDCWNFGERTLTMDPRWDAFRIVREDADNVAGCRARTEIPPKFVDGQPEISPGYDQPIAACIAIPDLYFRNHIVIKLADEGLTDEIMDNFRPTIVVSEIVGNRRDCTILYEMHCSLKISPDADHHGQTQMIVSNKHQRGYHNERKGENDSWVGVQITQRFKKSEAEGWHRVEHAFKDYPKGMRYLTLFCMRFGFGQDDDNNYGLKLANCSLKALCEKNSE